MESIAFERVFGPLTIQERIDVAGALAAWAALRAAGDRHDVTDFIPRWDREVEEQSDEQIVAFMRGVQQQVNEREDGKQ